LVVGHTSKCSATLRAGTRAGSWLSGRGTGASSRPITRDAAGMGPAESLRERRQRLGITQTELARRVGTSQSAIAAYESGAKSPSAETLDRLDRSLAGLPGQTLADRRDDVIALLARHRATRIRVFGSVARGEDTFDSDIDLLVDFDKGCLTLRHGRPDGRPRGVAGPAPCRSGEHWWLVDAGKTHQR